MAACPVCGRGAGLGFWERAQGYDAVSHFVTVQAVGLGRGKNFGVIAKLGPEADQDGLFPLVRVRFLRVLAEWVGKGWLSASEVVEAVRGRERAGPPS